ncbi:hypothetical protein [Amycolatopsis jiangsuensis]|uniref:Secreted protein n=1 Tax=Amycolatopsis jiangsuensis TaxID=1181879 RepID=A0A840J7X0_9PSEU|nr:hypothetical protein [Amycolatopsis jiangsuensis]MBB4689522.1 hypothetical protein [Amycolatopsis jiangsuensis]
MGVMRMKRGTITGVVAGAVLLAAGGTSVAFAQSDASDMPEATTSGAPANANGESQGSVVTGDYYVWLHTLNDEGEGLGTGIAPHTTQDLGTTLHPSGGGWTPTMLKFTVGEDSEGPAVATYAIPAAGKFVACTATGTEADPDIQCTAR